MNKTVAYCSLLAVAAFLGSAVVCRPDFLSDENHFFIELVGVNLLLVAGVILTITLASAGQVHLTLNEIESRKGRVFLSKTRRGVHTSSYWLIALFLATFPIVILKHYSDAPVWQAFFNAAALFVLFFMVLIMATLTRLIFAIKPHHPDPEDHAS